MNIKRLLLAIITFISLFSVFFALGQSLGEPQIQARLQLYQTNLILHATELKTDFVSAAENNSGSNLSTISKTLIGTNPYTIAQEQYQEAIDITQKVVQELENQAEIIPDAVASGTPREKLQKELTENKEFLTESQLNLAILEAKQNKIDEARQHLQKLEDNRIAVILSNLWAQQPQVLDNAVEEVNTYLHGWFRYAVLQKIYQLDNNTAEVLSLENTQQDLARKATLRLIGLSIIPVLGGLIGLGLIIFLLAERLIKKEQSILTTNQGLSWETPWNWEIVWQVLIVGFFFISQVLLPLLFGIIGFNPTNFSIRGKAFYVLITYLLMSGGGLLVLYVSLKSFLPLPPDWFRLKGNNWLLWGVGGYLVAIPSVFLVSIINQQLWQGQGGSNPLLFLALKAQDQVALAIFFFTASVAAPVFEEIMFRGFLLPSLTRYLPVWGAIIVSALIFSFAHLSLAEVLPLATLGIILGFVYTRSRNLLSSILIHSLWNSGTLLSLFVLGSSLD